MNKSFRALILIILIILSSILVISCAESSGVRKVAGANELLPPEISEAYFLEAIKQIQEDVASKAFNSKVCVNYLKTVEDETEKLDVRRILRGNLKKEAPHVVEASWEIRKTLHSRLTEFDKECVYQIQSSFQQFRFIEEFLLERLTDVQDMKPEGVDFQKQLTPMLEDAPYYSLMTVNPNTKVSNAKGGDIFISRGLSFLSAMIARLGVRPTQFSHIVFVYENADKKLQTIESYVGSGVAFYDFPYALKNENARILWLRAKDTKLAAKASYELGEYVKKNRIHYDYELDFDNHDTMSCAEVSRFAYKNVSDGKFILPYYPNEIVGAQTFLDHIGMKGGKTYEPGDMEIDPRFELMGEFRDLRLTRDSRQKDAILSAMYRWMDVEGYILYDSMKSKMAGGIIYSARHSFLWPLVRKTLKLDDFSKEIPRKMLRTVTILNQIGTELLAHVREKDRLFQLKSGLPMSPRHLAKTLEDFRQDDLNFYLKKGTRKQSKFHAWFRPKKNKN